MKKNYLFRNDLNFFKQYLENYLNVADDIENLEDIQDKLLTF